jgi:hypothetical protein
MHSIKINDKEYYLRSDFSELTQSELLKVAFIRSQHLDFSKLSQIEFNAIRIVAFKELSNVPLKIINQIKAVEWVDLLEYVNWVFKAPTLKENLLPKIKTRLRTFVGPIGMLDKSTMEEMTQADTAFTSFTNQKDVEKLYLLTAILYRPIRKDLAEFQQSTKWNGDMREPLNMTKAKARIKLFKRVPMHIHVAILLYFWSFRETKLMPFKRVFKVSESNQGTNRGWAGTMLEMAHLPVFGNINQIGEQNWFTVVYEMDRQLENKEMREKELERSKK